MALINISLEKQVYNEAQLFVINVAYESLKKSEKWVIKLMFVIHTCR